MKFFLILLLIALVLYIIFTHLLKQSKNPSGRIGNIMMKLWNKVYLPMAKWCLSFLEEKRFNNILDIGIGNGATTKYISQTFTSASIIGIDISKKAIEQAKNMNSEQNITFEIKDINNTEFPSNYFDLICAFQNHFHWNNLQSSFLEIKRLLSDKGIVVIGCEYSKVKYYLPDLTEPQAFEVFLNGIELRLVQVEKKNDWIFYKIAAQSI